MGSIPRPLISGSSHISLGSHERGLKDSTKTQGFSTGTLQPEGGFAPILSIGQAPKFRTRCRLGDLGWSTQNSNPGIGATSSTSETCLLSLNKQSSCSYTIILYTKYHNQYPFVYIALTGLTAPVIGALQPPGRKPPSSERCHLGAVPNKEN